MMRDRNRKKNPAGQDVLAQIDRGEFQPVYVLLGPDSVLVDTIIAKLKEKVVNPGLEAFDLELLAADDLDDEDLEQRLRQLPVGARRLVVIRDITRPGRDGVVFDPELRKSGVEKLCQTVAQVQKPKSGIHNPTIVVLTGLSSKPLASLLTTTGLGRFIVEMKQPERNDLESLVSAWAQERGITLTPEAVELLIEISGTDTGTLRGEVEKLATCLAPGAEATAADVRELAGSSREYALNEYVELVTRRDAAAALGVLRRLEAAGEDIPRIVAWLTTALLDLVGAKAKYVSSYARRRIGDAVQLWPDLAELNAILRQLYWIQKAMLEGDLEPFARLELLTYCVGCGRSSGWCRLAADGQYWRACVRRPGRTGVAGKKVVEPDV